MGTVYDDLAIVFDERFRVAPTPGQALAIYFERPFLPPSLPCLR